MDLYISPSKVELYRKFLENEYRGAISHQNVIDYIRGVSISTPRSNFGSAYHLLIEHGPEKYLDWVTGEYVVILNENEHLGSFEEVRFTNDQVEPVIRYRAKYPKMIYEVRNTYTCNVDGVNVVVPMKVDGLNGLEIHEHKTVGGDFNYAMFSRSLQWKIYLLALKGSLVQYNIFSFSQPPDEVQLKVKYRAYEFYTYPHLESDVIEYFRGFIKFCERENLLNYLERPKSARDVPFSF